MNIVPGHSSNDLHAHCSYRLQLQPLDSQQKSSQLFLKTMRSCFFIKCVWDCNAWNNHKFLIIFHNMYKS